MGGGGLGARGDSDADGGRDAELAGSGAGLDTPAGRPRKPAGASAPPSVDELARSFFEKNLKPALYRVVPEVELKMATLDQADGARARRVPLPRSWRAPA